ncbi:cobalamin-dependent protein [Haliangium ochraceum]|uniref:cobalamin-dependent protein n=1 Tax=Haliangium ochraceum TaxID=80816 RepID=UPI0018F032E7|nr:cobalamin-dependent protein [Haliangium ochraceum]
MTSPNPSPSVGGSDVVILGITRSDAHVVANILIAHQLRRHGYVVVNLGVCTPTLEFMRTYRRHPDALAIAIGSMNGHGYEDLADLPRLRQQYNVGCPIILGGNLGIEGKSRFQVEDRFKALGVTMLLDTPEELLVELDRLREERARMPAILPSVG